MAEYKGRQPDGTTLVLLGWCSTQLAMDSTWPRVALPTRPSIHYLHGSRTRPVPPCLCQLVVGDLEVNNAAHATAA